jgi:hypothetical protein
VYDAAAELTELVRYRVTVCVSELTRSMWLQQTLVNNIGERPGSCDDAEGDDAKQRRRRSSPRSAK